MGKATVLSGGTDGLYTIRPVYNTAPLDRLIADLTKAKAEQLTLLGRATETLNLLESETEIARRAMNAVINQWQQDLLNTENPPPIVPPTEDDPETGQPWEPQDKAQYGPLEDAINAARTAAGKSTLTRDDDLDFAARRHAWDMSGRRLMGHIGSDKSVPTSRIAATGYQADFAVELVACGAFTAESAAAQWTINSASSIYSDTATQLGVAYTYSTSHPATHLWVALLAHPDPDPDPSPPTVTYPDDPAQKTAREQEAGLEKIEPPKTKVLAQPAKLTDVVRKFGIAAGKEAAARKELAKLLAEYDQNNRKLDELEALKTGHESESIPAWCADLSEELAAGTLVDTFEPPGFRDGDRLHIAPYQSSPQSWAASEVGKLRDAPTMTDSAVLYAYLIEPGHYKWRPLWRYAEITAIQSGADTCNLTLESVNARSVESETLSLNSASTLSAVPIAYMSCNSAAFEVGDRVIVLFEGQDRAHPKVIGFASNPRDCGGWIESFDAAVYDLGANEVAAWTGLLIPSGDGWPISNTVPYTGATGLRFQEWLTDYADYLTAPLVRAYWGGGNYYSDTVDTTTYTGNLSVYVTGNHHKMIVADYGENDTGTGYAGDGDLLVSTSLSSVPRRYCSSIIFPDDCRDFLVNGEASFDFPIWLDWDTLEVQFTISADVGLYGGYYQCWLQLFFWAGFSIYDVIGISDQAHMGLYGVSWDANPIGTSMAFVPFNLGDSTGDNTGSVNHERYLNYEITHDYDHHIWSNNNPSPYDLGHAHAPVGYRYYCVYDPTIASNLTRPLDGLLSYEVASGINARHTFKVPRALIDPGHTIDAVQVARQGYGNRGRITLHSIRFYKDEA
jgi:uncharacterized protein YkwD